MVKEARYGLLLAKDGINFCSSGNAANTRHNSLYTSPFFENTRLTQEKTVQFSGLLRAPVF